MTLELTAPTGEIFMVYIPKESAVAVIPCSVEVSKGVFIDGCTVQVAGMPRIFCREGYAELCERFKGDES